MAYIYGESESEAPMGPFGLDVDALLEELGQTLRGPEPNTGKPAERVPKCGLGYVTILHRCNRLIEELLDKHKSVSFDVLCPAPTTSRQSCSTKHLYLRLHADYTLHSDCTNNNLELKTLPQSP